MGEGGTKQNPSMFSAYVSKETIDQTKALAYLRKAVIFDQKFRGAYTEVSPNSHILSLYAFVILTRRAENKTASFHRILTFLWLNQVGFINQWGCSYLADFFFFE